MTRHMFAGGTAPVGFVNYFDQIMPLEKAKKRIFLKGSSGSGKSTFMKKIAAELEKAGLDTDIYHCANDAGSLDGLSVKDKGVCIIDGTAPHVNDPEVPIAVDTIIDFAAFIDYDKVFQHREEIQSLLCVKKLLTEKARGYLTAAGNVYTADRSAYEAALKRPALMELTHAWTEMLGFDKKINFSGADRKMFLTAVTPDGVVSFASTVLDGCKVYGLKGEGGAGTELFLRKMRDAVHGQGMNTDSFPCPFDPDKLEYLLAPEMKTAFAVTGMRGGYEGPVDEMIDLGGCYDGELLKAAKNGLERNQGLFNRLLDEAVAFMKESRTMHSGIEKIYIDAMRFDEIDEMTEKILGGLI